MRYERYKRGQIILVNFSPSTGSETSGKHLAIVLTKKDQPVNGVLTVIPLTSKNKKYYLPLGNILLPELSVHLNNEYEKMKISKFKHIVDTYLKMNKDSFAMVGNITTISKFRVVKPMGKYDPIKKFKVDDDILNKIDDELKRLFTA